MLDRNDRMARFPEHREKLVGREYARRTSEFPDVRLTPDRMRE